MVVASSADKASARGRGYGLGNWQQLLTDEEIRMEATLTIEGNERDGHTLTAAAPRGWCVYCDREVSDVTIVPVVDDDETWEKLASEHQEWCEWVQTRAHRVR